MDIQRVRCIVIALALAVLFGALPVRAAENDAVPLVIGTSVEGRAITATRYGTGPRSVVIVGAIHGDEGNTAALADYLSAAFRDHLDLLPSDASLYIISALNPDGLAVNRRTNAHGVDLNRNWQTDNWQADTVDSDGRRSNGGGSAPFSEPESRALADWLAALRDSQGAPVTVLFYHAAYPPRGLVLAGSVGRAVGRAFADVVGYNGPSDTGGGSGWSAYPVTGAAVGWCRNTAIGCFEIELPNHNALGAAALQSHAAAILGVLLREQTAPGQRCFWETGMCIAGRIRAFWQANDGLRTLGLPLTREQTQTIADQDRVVQWFERARLELHPESAAPDDVQLGALGTEALAQQARAWWTEPRASMGGPCQSFATAHSICGEMLQAWRAHGLNRDGRAAISEAESLALFGQPLSDAQPEQLADGRSVVVQWFERARFEIDPAAPPSERVRFGRLGSERVALGE